MRLLLREQQVKLRSPVRLQREPPFPAGSIQEDLAFTKGLHQGKYTAPHQKQAAKLSKVRTTKAKDILALWKRNEYPRDTRTSDARTKMVKVPPTMVAQTQVHQPMVLQPVTPADQIWDCTARCMKEHKEALKTLRVAMRHVDQSDSEDEVETQPLGDVFDTVQGSMPETVEENIARRTAFNARLTQDFVDCVEKKAKSRANPDGSPIPTTKVCVPAEWRDLYRARRAKLVQARPCSTRPTQILAGRRPSTSPETGQLTNAGKSKWCDVEPILPCVQLPQPAAETDRIGADQIAPFSAEPGFASVSFPDLYFDPKHLGAGNQDVHNGSMPYVAKLGRSGWPGLLRRQNKVQISDTIREYESSDGQKGSIIDRRLQSTQ